MVLGASPGCTVYEYGAQEKEGEDGDGSADGDAAVRDERCWKILLKTGAEATARRMRRKVRAQLTLRIPLFDLIVVLVLLLFLSRTGSRLSRRGYFSKREIDHIQFL